MSAFVAGMIGYTAVLAYVHAVTIGFLSTPSLWLINITSSITFWVFDIIISLPHFLRANFVDYRLGLTGVLASLAALTTVILTWDSIKTWYLAQWTTVYNQLNTWFS